MANYRLSNEAKDDLIRIHQYGIRQFGVTQADKYFDSLFEYFEIIANRPFSFESIDYLKKVIGDVYAGQIAFFLKLTEM